MKINPEYKDVLLAFGSFLYGFAMHSAREVFIREFRENGKIPQGIDLYLKVAKQMREIAERRSYD